MAFAPENLALPYGPLIESTARIVTWNVWGLYGPWREREAGIVTTLANARPDVVVLTEAWARQDGSQAERFAEPLGLPHHAFTGVPAQEDESALSGVAVLSKWPIGRASSHAFGGLRAQFAELEGPRGPIRVYGVVVDAWWLDESAARQDAVRGLLDHARSERDAHVPLVLCGDFNADPDSDEIRMLTGRTAVPVPGLSFYDAWEVGGAGTPGSTWSGANPWTRPLLWPDRRIDYIFTATGARGGAGHPLSADVLGVHPVDGVYPSDHFAVQADVRY